MYIYNYIAECPKMVIGPDSKMGRHSSNIMIECVKVGEVFCGV